MYKLCKFQVNLLFVTDFMNLQSSKSGCVNYARFCKPSHKLRIWMCELCTFLQTQSQITYCSYICICILHTVAIIIAGVHIVCMYAATYVYTIA